MVELLIEGDRVAAVGVGITDGGDEDEVCGRGLAERQGRRRLAGVADQGRTVRRQHDVNLGAVGVEGRERAARLARRLEAGIAHRGEHHRAVAGAADRRRAGRVDAAIGMAVGAVGAPGDAEAAACERRCLAVEGLQGGQQVGDGVAGDLRRVVVDDHREGAGGGVAVRVHHRELDAEIDAVLGAGDRMIERLQQREGVGAGTAGIEGDGVDLVGGDGRIGAVDVADDGRQAAERRENVGDRPAPGGDAGERRLRRREDERRRQIEAEVDVEGAGDGGGLSGRIAGAADDALAQAFVVDVAGRRRADDRLCVAGLGGVVGGSRAIRVAEQIERRAGRERVDRRVVEVGARSRAAALAGGRQHRLVGGDGKQRREFAAGDDAVAAKLDADGTDGSAGGVEERFDRHRRLVVEQYDQAVADADERDLLVGDVGQVEPGSAVEMDGDRLTALRLCYLDDMRLRRVGRLVERCLRNLYAHVHSTTPTDISEKCISIVLTEINVFVTLLIRQEPYGCSRDFAQL